MRQILLSVLLSVLLASAALGSEPISRDEVAQAARAGNEDAQLQMGILYEFGFNMPNNDVPALAWYMLAAKQGNQLAIKRRDLLMSRMNQTQIEQARKESETLVPSQSEQVSPRKQ
jgi:TPR repeat protein